MPVLIRLTPNWRNFCFPDRKAVGGALLQVEGSRSKGWNSAQCPSGWGTASAPLPPGPRPPTLPAPDRFQAAGCPVPIERGQQSLILGQLQGLAVALCGSLVVLVLEMPVPFLLQLHGFHLRHLSGWEQLCLAGPNLQTQGWTPDLRSGAPGSPPTWMEGEDSGWKGPTPGSTPKSITPEGLYSICLEKSMVEGVLESLCLPLCPSQQAG